MSTETNGVTVTIKHGKGYDDSWLVARGSVDEVRALLVESYALAGMNDAPLGRVIAAAQNAAGNADKIGNVKGAGADLPVAELVAKELDAKPAKRATRKPAAKKAAAKTDDAPPWNEDEDPWKGLGDDKAEPQFDGSNKTDPFHQFTTRTSLREWGQANRQKLGASKALMDLFKSKGASLPADS